MSEIRPEQANINAHLGEVSASLVVSILREFIVFRTHMVLFKLNLISFKCIINKELSWSVRFCTCHMLLVSVDHNFRIFMININRLLYSSKIQELKVSRRKCEKMVIGS